MASYLKKKEIKTIEWVLAFTFLCTNRGRKMKDSMRGVVYSTVTDCVPALMSSSLLWAVRIQGHKTRQAPWSHGGSGVVRMPCILHPGKRLFRSATLHHVLLRGGQEKGEHGGEQARCGPCSLGSWLIEAERAPVDSINIYYSTAIFQILH